MWNTPEDWNSLSLLDTWACDSKQPTRTESRWTGPCTCAPNPPADWRPLSVLTVWAFESWYTDPAAHGLLPSSHERLSKPACARWEETPHARYRADVGPLLRRHSEGLGWDGFLRTPPGDQPSLLDPTTGPKVVAEVRQVIQFMAEHVDLVDDAGILLSSARLPLLMANGSSPDLVSHGAVLLAWRLLGIPMNPQRAEYPSNGGIVCARPRCMSTWRLEAEHPEVDETSVPRQLFIVFALQRHRQLAEYAVVLCQYLGIEEDLIGPLPSYVTGGEALVEQLDKIDDR